ncbi:inositol phosphorylceramide glucuronosyltransferase 1-like isoform X3 [Magnolia sinica]|uniref:inositol phosphorylceramide glucuronosyltransferase 1-like isoform X3 n=1 Tax=Magnolia sinica TaxID=86752 RepID=UPI0026593338|nr:inositol phosphorylceramide glucuronosyltransferase 1-like isoform X3 [Magnolia sinica]
MRSSASNLGCLLVFAIAFAGICGKGVAGIQSEAYVTLLYGDEFLLGVRVLGKSIRETGSTKDMVVLASYGVSDYAKKLLRADGWIVELISLLANPNQIRPKRFWGVYTKLKIFNMTNYKKGDQGFLNSYYAGFANAHIFDPNLSADVVNSRPVPEMERLSTLYNADVGLYMLANKWMVDEKELRIIHYTLGPLKPWDWWTAWLLKPVDIWQNVREQLEESLPGTGGGRNPNEQLLVKFLFVLPLCVLLFCCYRSFLQHRDLFDTFCRSSFCNLIKCIYYKYKSGGGHATYSTIGVTSPSIINSNQQFSNGSYSKLPAYLGGISVFICFIAAAVSLRLAFIVVPRQVMPWTGLLLMYEWTFTSFFIIFGSYLHLVYEWGKATATPGGTFSPQGQSSDYDSGKGHQRQVSNCDTATWFYGIGMAVLAVAAPSLPCLLGITALFARLGLMVGGGLVLASFMTYASEHLAVIAFVRGREDCDQPQSRSLCFLC